MYVGIVHVARIPEYLSISICVYVFMYMYLSIYLSARTPMYVSHHHNSHIITYMCHIIPYMYFCIHLSIRIIAK